MRLLCATDLSSRSERALRRSAVLARETGADLVVLSVVDDDQPESLVASERREVSALLAETVRGLPEREGLQPRLRVEAGDPFDAIIRVAREENADLVVMGAHRKRLLLDMFLGTTVERVMRRGRRPVLMASRPAEGPYRRVLAATDLSEASARALCVTDRLGLARDGEMTVFHAFLPLARSSMIQATLPAEAVAEHVAETAAQARREVHEFLDGLDFVTGGPLPLKVAVAEGAPVEALRRAVERFSSDLVVIGTRGHGAMGRLLLGSVAEEALRTLDCDVLVVPPEAE